MLDEACSWRRPLSFNILLTGGKQIESENPNRNQHDKNEFDRTESDINTEWTYVTIFWVMVLPKPNPNPNGYLNKLKI